MIVEDDALIRMLAADMISAMGMDIVEAVNADHAIALLESIPKISVVFSDVQMPGSMDGIRLMTIIRNRWPPIALLLTSGKVSPPACDLPTGTHFVTKPYHSQQIEGHLTSLIDEQGQ